MLNTGNNLVRLFELDPRFSTPLASCQRIEGLHTNGSTWIPPPSSSADFGGGGRGKWERTQWSVVSKPVSPGTGPAGSSISNSRISHLKGTESAGRRKGDCRRRLVTPNAAPVTCPSATGVASYKSWVGRHLHQDYFIRLNCYPRWYCHDLYETSASPDQGFRWHPSGGKPGNDGRRRGSRGDRETGYRVLPRLLLKAEEDLSL